MISILSDEDKDRILRKCGILANFDTLQSIVDETQFAVLEKLRGRDVKPVAWDVYVAEADNGYLVDDIDDPQLVDDCTNHNAEVTPLYTATDLAAAVVQEREQCAQLCERLATQQETDVRDQCAAAIRSRKGAE